MPAMPRSAVVLCSYNGERFLPAQLDSLRAQTRQPDVYVLSDDVSSDAGWDLLQAFGRERAEAGCEVILHRNDANLGYVRHFEQALQRADAEVLFPCDQDDVWHSRKIERMLAEFARRPGLMVLHGDARLVDGEGRDLGRRLLQVLEVTPAELTAMHAGRGFDVLLRRNIVTGAAMALRREVLRDALPVADHWAHDEWLALIGAMLGEADTLEEAVIDYRQHGGNQIGVRERSVVQRHLGLGVGRRAFLQRLVSRQQGLLAHIKQQGGDVDSVGLNEIRDRLTHAEVRAHLAPSLPARVPQVLREWRSGRYTRFGSGWRSVMTDLLGID